jgi:hypothetical protein
MDISEFKNTVHEWMTLNQDVKETQATLREKKKRMQHLSTYIMSYMKHIDKEVCNVGDVDALVLKTKKVTGALKRPHIESIFHEICNGDTDTANTYIQRLYGMRETSTKNVLTLSAIR